MVGCFTVLFALVCGVIWLVCLQSPPFYMLVTGTLTDIFFDEKCWIVFILLGGFAFFHFRKKVRKTRSARRGPWHRTPQAESTFCNDSDPTIFEHIVRKALQFEGWIVEHTGGLDDRGVDLIARRGEEVAAVQCKKYIYEKISLEQMRSFLGAMHSATARAKFIRGLYVSLSGFTDQAKDFANNNHIKCWGRETLKAVLIRNKTQWDNELKNYLTVKRPQCECGELCVYTEITGPQGTHAVWSCRNRCCPDIEYVANYFAEL